MDRLIDRYLDGELTPDEAEELSAALAGDPELEAELRARERMLAGIAALDEPLPDGFADRAMDRVRAAERGDGRRTRSAFRGAPLALAATFVLCFVLGYVVARLGAAPPGATAPRQAAAPTLAALDEAGGLRFVRLVYSPGGERPGSVAVAGTFNGWNPELTPMSESDGAWAALLLLPPETHEYVFVIDGERWVPDPLAPTTRDDGFGNANSVLELSL